MNRPVVAATGVAGAGLLGASLATKPGDGRFHRLTAATAATWIGGSLLAGRVRWGDPRVLVPALLGVAAFLPFYGIAVVCKRIPVLNRLLRSVLAYAQRGDTRSVLATTLVTGAAEEVFFRGAVYAALDGSVSRTTGVYVLNTVSTRNPMLVLASVFMGALFTLQRRRSGGIGASMITHLVWSTLMLLFLTPLFPQ
ncbi:CPBP family intramembrane metalloprotease [Pseudonocardiaceae bacterium YIM PH 21723]|nr:CPBP family intramembrane metalloprotease [Pseudonocardiaceae bacterium YIM PH 21723]